MGEYIHASTSESVVTVISGSNLYTLSAMKLSAYAFVCAETFIFLCSLYFADVMPPGVASMLLSQQQHLRRCLLRAPVQRLWRELSSAGSLVSGVSGKTHVYSLPLNDVPTDCPSMRVDDLYNLRSNSHAGYLGAKKYNAPSVQPVSNYSSFIDSVHPTIWTDGATGPTNGYGNIFAVDAGSGAAIAWNFKRHLSHRTIATLSRPALSSVDRRVPLGLWQGQSREFHGRGGEKTLHEEDSMRSDIPPATIESDGASFFDGFGRRCPKFEDAAGDVVEGRGPKSAVYFESYSLMIPHPSKKKRGGEDAASCSTSYLAVADGVGGWESSGIDAGLYAKELIGHVESAWNDEKNKIDVDPVRVLKKAYLKTRAIGSSTCCLVLMDWRRKSIRAANLGDSGFFLYRPGAKKVVARSEFQCHSFNFPLQLGTGSSDVPEHAHTIDVRVQEGDLLLVATDGLWDNVFDEQLIEILDSNSTTCEKIDMIGRIAYTLSQNPEWGSPFASKEHELLGLTGKHLGGKPDDISVVLAVVRQNRE